MTAPATGKWSDLAPRVISALAMVAVGLAAVWYGGVLMRAIVAIAAAAMIWELLRMLVPKRTGPAIFCAIGAAVSIWVAPLGSLALEAAIFAMASGSTAFFAGRKQILIFGYAFVLLVGSFALILVRENLGTGWVIWLICIVVASDVAGYFAGKTFGGPKFWPSISPKKTWSGTVAGWIAAGGVGFFFAAGSGLSGPIILLSILLSFVGQMGDIAESAIKRRTGVKDSSSLIPGHGGVLDRFDALTAAAFMLFVFGVMTGFPERLF